MRIILLTLTLTFILSASYAGTPDLRSSIGFVENRGQLTTNPDVRYYLKRDNVTVYFKDSEIVYQLKTVVNGELHIENISLNLNAQNSKIESISPYGAKLFYNFGDVRTVTNSYESIVYKDVYDGIDLHYYLNGSSLKYDFIVKPGADYNQIKIDYSTLRNINLDNTGCVVVSTSLGNIEENEPYTYQGSFDDAIHSAYKFNTASNTLSFEVGDYDKSKNLVIDPEVEWTKLFGGSGTDEGLAAIVTGADGSIFLGGGTFSDDLEQTEGRYQEELDEQQDGFLAKFDIDGNLIWATYFGADGDDRIYDLDIDSNGNIYAVGYTTSRPNEFPLLPAGQDVSGQGGDDAFVAKFSSEGQLLFSRLYGGTSSETSFDIDVYSDTEIFFVGTSGSSDLGVTTTLLPAGSSIGDSGDDAFIIKINQDGEEQWATIYGGSLGDAAIGMGVDINGNPVIAGNTASEDLSEVNPIEFTDDLSGAESGRDGFLAKFDGATGATLLFASYVGGTGDDYVHDVKVESDGTMIYCGYTASTNFLPQPENDYGGGVSDGFVGSVEPDGTSNWVNYLGGSEQDRAWEILIDALGNILVNGGTESFDFPVQGIDPLLIQRFKRQEQDAFFATYSENGAKTYATYLGGDQEDFTYDMALDQTRVRVILAGTTRSDNLIGLEEGTMTQASDAFIMSIDLTDDFCPQLSANGISSIGDEVCLSEGETLYITGTEGEIFPGDIGLTYSYQYQLSINGSAYTDIPGATSRDLPGFTITETGEYRLRRLMISDDFSSCVFASEPEVFNAVDDDISGNTIESDEDDSATPLCQSQVTISGSEAISAGGFNVMYQYQISDDNVTFTDISGATDQDLLSIPSSASGTVYIRREARISEADCPDFSDALEFNLFDDEITSNTISSDDEDKVVCVSESGTYNIVGAEATSSNPGATISYQYEVSIDGGATFTDVVGGNTQNLPAFNPTSGDVILVRRRVITGLGGDCSGENVSNVLTFNTTDTFITVSSNTITDSPATACEDDVIDIDGNPATSTNGEAVTYQYQISVNGGAFENIPGATNEDLTIDGDLPSGTIELRRIATAGGASCADASSSISIDITNDDIADNVISSDGDLTDLCLALAPFAIDGDPVTSTGTVTYQYQVSDDGGDTFVDIVGEDAEDATFSPSAAGTYTVRRTATSTNGNDCVDRSNYLTFVVTNSDVSDNSISASTTDVCNGEGEQISFDGTTASATTAVTYQYQVSINNGDFMDVLNGNTEDLVVEANQLPGGTAVYRRLAIAAGNDCPNISAEVTITVNDDFIINNRIFSEQVGVFCPDEVPLVIASAPTSATSGSISYQYQRSTDGGATWMDISGATTRDYDYTPDNFDDDEFRIRRIAESDAASDCRSISNQLIFQRLKGSVELDQAADSEVCIGEDVEFTIDSNGASELYLILFAGTTEADTIYRSTSPTPGEISVTYTASALGTYPVAISAVSSECDVLEQPFSFVVSETPTISFAEVSGGDGVCEGEEFTLTTIPALTDRDYSFANGDFIGDDENQNVAISTSGVYTINAVGDINGCPVEGSTTITVLQNPEVMATASQTEDLFVGQSVELQGSVTNGTPAVIEWTPSADVDMPNALVTDATPTMSTTYTLFVEAENGCSDSDDVTINLSDLAQLIPSAFTPNGDGVNDTFKVGLGDELAGTRVKYQIYNRWGDLLYETNDVNANPWDGTKDGEDLPQSVYYYTIDLGVGEEMEGTITLIR